MANVYYSSGEGTKIFYIYFTNGNIFNLMNNVGEFLKMSFSGTSSCRYSPQNLALLPTLLFSDLASLAS